jgi:hypothetical protein
MAVFTNFSYRSVDLAPSLRLDTDLQVESVLDNAVLKVIVLGSGSTRSEAACGEASGDWLRQRACRLLDLAMSVARCQAIPRDDESLRALLQALSIIMGIRIIWLKGCSAPSDL